jgi:methylenetetrahydrofolate dehydrogenase (NADP+)/methenyltetrahydrofolate cyclohydrolase
MTKILKASPLIESKIPMLIEKSHKLSLNGLKPNLSIILVGNNSASLLYVSSKKKFCEKIGADFNLISLDEDISEHDFLCEIEKLNSDPKVTGCFVQLPIPKQLNDIDITQLINPDKDVDGFHLNSVNQMYLGKLDGLISCTPKGIITLLIENKIELSGSHVVIIGRSYIVGRPLSLLLQAHDATVTLCHSKTKELKKHTKSADIIISAIGHAHFIDDSFLNPDKDQVLIDVGMNKKDGKTVGDMNFPELESKVKAITPVPGGVGPMTVYSLMENLLQATQNILNKTNKEN